MTTLAQSEQAPASVGRNIVSMALSRVSAIGLDAITYVLLARHLGPLEYGYYVAIAAFVSLVDVVADMMTIDVTVREISRHPAQGHTWLIAATVLRAALAMFGLMAFGVYAWVGPIGRDPSLAPIAVLAAIGLPLGALRTPLAAFRAHSKMHYEMGVLVATRAVNLLLVIWLVSRGDGLVPIMAAAVASRALLAVLAWGTLARCIGVSLQFDRQALVYLGREAMPLGVSGLFVAVQLKADIIIVAWLLGAHAGGIYGVVAQLPEYLLSIPIIFTAPMLPALSRYAARNDRAAFQRLFQTMFDTLMTLVIPLAVIAFVVPAPAIAALFGDKYSEAAVVLPIVMASVVFMWFSHATAVATLAGGLQLHFIWIQAICVVSYLALCSVLIPEWGSGGAATSRLVATVLAPLFTCVMLRRQLGVRVSAVALRRTVAPALAMAATLALGAQLPMPVMVPAGLALYGIGLWMSGFNPLERIGTEESRA